MSRTPEEVSQDILKKLSITDPSLSGEIGTPERKIIDSVAEAISEVYVDNYIVSNIWDINQKEGTDLDQFVAIFGFGRYMGRYSTGVVRFLLDEPAIQRFEVPVGTRVYVEGTDVSEPIYYTTLYPNYIARGSTYVDIDVQCVEVGVIGDTPINTITGYENVIGVDKVRNVEPIYGGADTETDDELRDRFKQTFLRNVSGTVDYYRGVGLSHDSVRRVGVYGPVSRHREQLQVTGGKFASLITQSKYTWPLGYFVATNLGLEGEYYYTQGVDYNADDLVPPSLEVISSRIPLDTVLEVEHEYTSIASRNDPAKGITNKIDVYIDGVDPILQTESTVFSAATFNGTSTSPLYNKNFIRKDGTYPTSGRRFQKLGSVPLVNVPSTLEIDNGTLVDTYREGADYNVVYDNTILRGSPYETSGIEWIRNPPNVGGEVNFAYTYNRIPEVLNAILRQSKQLTTDPIVHSVDSLPISINLVVIILDGYSQETVNHGLARAFTEWFESLEIADWIQMSDIEALAHSVSGVDAVRLGRTSDGFEKASVLTHFKSGAVNKSYTRDFKLGDDQIPILYGINTKVRSFNTFGAQ